MVDNIELMDVDKLNDYKTINNELKKISRTYGSCIHGHYIWDYPWIISQLPEKLFIKKNSKNKLHPGLRQFDSIPLRIMDAGSGLGTLQFYLMEKGAESYAFEHLSYGKKIKEMCSKYNPDMTTRFKDYDINFNQIYLGDARDTIPWENNYFDYIVSCSALEHNLPAYFENSINNCISLLKPGGKLIITLPFAKQYKIIPNMVIPDFNHIKNIMENNSDIVNFEIPKDINNTFDILYGKFIQNTNKFESFLPGGVVFEKWKS